jgi:hypothetical protein
MRSRFPPPPHGAESFPIRSNPPTSPHANQPPEAPQAAIDPSAADPVSEERKRIQRRIGGFRWRSSHAWHYLSILFGPQVSQEELLSIAVILAAQLNLRLDRDARRRKVVMIKWFQENWIRLEPVLGHIILE